MSKEQNRAGMRLGVGGLGRGELFYVQSITLVRAEYRKEDGSVRVRYFYPDLANVSERAPEWLGQENGVAQLLVSAPDEPREVAHVSLITLPDDDQAALLTLLSVRKGSYVELILDRTAKFVGSDGEPEHEIDVDCLRALVNDGRLTEQASFKGERVVQYKLS